MLRRARRPHAPALARFSSSTPNLARCVALMFPGQGAQRPGMAKDLAAEFPAARLVLDEVDDALQFFLSRLMFDGAPADLNQTVHTQPALLAHSMAVLRVLESEAGFGPGRAPLFHDGIGAVRLGMGHSVGEFAALCATGALSLADAARLLVRSTLHSTASLLPPNRRSSAPITLSSRTPSALSLQRTLDIALQRTRGEAMQRAAWKVGGSDATQMVALIPTTFEHALAACEEVRGAQSDLASELESASEPGSASEPDSATSKSASPTSSRVVDVANVNAAQQVVVSGEREAVQQVVELLRQRKQVRRAVELPVSAPFHCSLMAPAASVLAAALGVPQGGSLDAASPLPEESTTAAAGQSVDALVAAALEGHSPGKEDELGQARVVLPDGTTVSVVARDVGHFASLLASKSAARSDPAAWLAEDTSLSPALKRQLRGLAPAPTHMQETTIPLPSEKPVRPSPLRTTPRLPLEMDLDPVWPVRLVRPVVPVVSNVHARAESDPAALRRLLVEQVTSPVRWSDCVAFAARALRRTEDDPVEGRALEADRAGGLQSPGARVLEPLFLELGSGSTLTSLNRQNAPASESLALGTFEDVRVFLRRLRGREER